MSPLIVMFLMTSSTSVFRDAFPQARMPDLLATCTASLFSFPRPIFKRRTEMKNASTGLAFSRGKRGRIT
jgi:hypothetical protein